MKRIVNGIEIEMTQDEINNLNQDSTQKILQKTQEKKKVEINNFRDYLLNLDSPHTVGATYLLELNGEQVRFQVNQSTKTDLIANIIDLKMRLIMEKLIQPVTG